MSTALSDREVAPVVRPQRRIDIDALRVMAVLLLVYFHTGMVFNTWRFHIKNAELSETVTGVTRAIGQWHMPLFMLLAGASTYLALGYRSPGQYANERLRRLLLPLVFGMLVVIPPQVYVERISWAATPRMSPHNFQGSFWQFYPQYFLHGTYPKGNISWHHLWFVAYLLVYSLVLLPVFMWLERFARVRTTPSEGMLAGEVCHEGLFDGPEGTGRAGL